MGSRLSRNNRVVSLFKTIKGQQNITTVSVIYDGESDNNENGGVTFVRRNQDIGETNVSQFQSCLNGNSQFLSNFCANLRYNYMQAFVVCCNFCSVSCWRFDDNDQASHWTRKTSYYILNALACFETVRLVKLCVEDAVWANETTEIGAYMSILNTFSVCITRVMFQMSLLRNDGKLSSLLTTINSTTFAEELNDRKKFATAVALFVIGCIQSIMRSLNGIENGAHHFMESRSNRIREIFGASYNDGTDSSSLDNSTIILGIFSFLINLMGNFLDQVANIGVLLAAMTLASACSMFRFKEISPGMEAETVNVSNSNQHPIMNRFSELKQISKALNSALSSITKCVLLGNLFMFAVFLDICFDSKILKVYKALFILDIAFALATFYIANVSAKKAEQFREWIMIEENRISLELSQTDVILEEMASHSIGIGKGAFYINDNFMLGYVGAIAAYFFSIVETRAKDKACEYTVNIDTIGHGNVSNVIRTISVCTNE